MSPATRKALDVVMVRWFEFRLPAHERVCTPAGELTRHRNLKVTR